MMKFKEDVVVKRKQKETERKNDEVIKFKEKIENKVEIDNGNKVKAEAMILGDLKIKNKLTMKSEDEIGVLLEKGLMAEADARKDEVGIETDIEKMVNDGKETAMIKNYNEEK